MILLEDLHRAGCGRIDGAHRQRRRGADVRPQNSVGEIERAPRGRGAGQRRVARSADEAVQAVGQVVESRQGLLDGGDPGTGNLEGGRVRTTEFAVTDRSGRGRDRQRVGRAGRERRGRPEELVIAEVRPCSRRAGRERGSRRGGRGVTVEADRNTACTVADGQRQVCERGPPAGRRSCGGRARCRVGRGRGRGGRCAGALRPQRSGRARHEHCGRAGKHGSANGGRSRHPSPCPVPFRTHPSPLSLPG